VGSRLLLCAPLLVAVLVIAQSRAGRLRFYLRTRGCLGGCSGADVRAALFRGHRGSILRSSLAAPRSRAPLRAKGPVQADPLQDLPRLRLTCGQHRSIRAASKSSPRIPIGFQGCARGGAWSCPKALPRRAVASSTSRPGPMLRVHRSEPRAHRARRRRQPFASRSISRSSEGARGVSLHPRSRLYRSRARLAGRLDNEAG